MSDPRYYKRRGSGDGGAPYAQLERDEKELRESLSPWRRLWAFLNRPIRMPWFRREKALLVVTPPLKIPLGLTKSPFLDHMVGRPKEAINTFHAFSRSNLPRNLFYCPRGAQDRINLFNTMAVKAARKTKLLGLDDWEYSRG